MSSPFVNSFEAAPINDTFDENIDEDDEPQDVMVFKNT
jgi:hypothetical protein